MSAPPFDAEAEAELVGAMLSYPEAIEAALTAQLVAGDFHDGTYSALFDAITGLYGREEPVNPVTVGDRLAAMGKLEAVGGRPAVLRLMAATTASWNSSRTAALVRRLSQWRAAAAWGAHVNHAALSARADDGAELERLLGATESLLAAPITESVAAADVVDLLAEPPPVPKPWVIPGLIRRGETLVLTGGEGAGKMSVLRQCILGVAAGVHPFTGQLMTRQRGLIVDLQEDSTDLRGELGKPMYRSFVRALHPGWLHATSRRGGINLLAAQDARRFEALLIAYQPTLVVMGPLKRIYQPPPGRGIWDDDVVEALHVRLDRWLDRYGFALMLEGHAGHDRDLWRVKGSSAWYAWPSFGYGLNPVSWRPRECEVVRWRGDRNPDPYPRAWPSKLTEGAGVAWNADQEAIDEMRRAHDRGDAVEQPDLLDDGAETF